MLIVENSVTEKFHHIFPSDVVKNLSLKKEQVMLLTGLQEGAFQNQRALNEKIL